MIARISGIKQYKLNEIAMRTWKQRRLRLEGGDHLL